MTLRRDREPHALADLLKSSLRDDALDPATSGHKVPIRLGMLQLVGMDHARRIVGADLS